MLLFRRGFKSFGAKDQTQGLLDFEMRSSDSQINVLTGFEAVLNCTEFLWEKECGTMSVRTLSKNLSASRPVSWYVCAGIFRVE